jgi:hypothetical protein
MPSSTEIYFYRIVKQAMPTRNLNTALFLCRTAPCVAVLVHERSSVRKSAEKMQMLFKNKSRPQHVTVCIVSGYGLDDQAMEVRSPAGAKGFSSNLCIQTGSGAHPASCTMGTVGPFPGGKARSGRDADHSPPSSAEVENE